MKKAISLFLTVIIIAVSLPFYAYAETTDNTTVSEQYKEIVGEYDADKSFTESIVLTEGENKLTLDGTELPISADEDLCPEMSDKGELMVPAETLCRYIDADYTDNEKGFDTVSYEDRKLTFDADCGAYALSEDRVDDIFVFDSIPYEKNGELMLPATEVADALGYECYEEESSIMLTRPYQSCRLLVSTTKKVNELNAVESVRDEENDITILQFETETDAIAAAEYYENAKSVSAVQPDFIMTACEGKEDEEEPFDDDEEPTNDDYEDTDELKTVDDHLSTFSSEWHGVDDMNDYLKTQKLTKVKVAVVDTGVCTTHERLQGRIEAAPVNFSDTGDNTSEDENGHGTHVAGIILDNTLDNVSVIGVKVLNKQGRGTSYATLEGVKYAASTGARVINMSLGGYGKDELLEEFINAQRYYNNLTVCVAAGNNGTYARYYCPAGINACITVGCQQEITRWPNKQLKHTLFTNSGYPVDIDAVGFNINSTTLDNNYAALSGTSMSSPAVAAAVAMMVSYNHLYTTDYIENRIRFNGLYQSPHFSFVPYCDEEHKEGLLWQYDVLSCRDLIDVERTATPTVNYDTNYYEEPITVELNCEDNAEIYYTTDGTRASKENGTLYTEPFVIDKPTRLHFVAFSDDKALSIQEFRDYYVGRAAQESDFEIDEDGTITAFNGEKKLVRYVNVPETINGITVTKIGKRAFKGNSSLRMITLPDTCKSLGLEAFRSCTSLTYIEGNGLEIVHESALRQCLNLTDVNFPELKEIGKYSFASCQRLPSFSNDKITKVPYQAFTSCKYLREVDLPNVTEIAAYAFATCWRLEQVSAPNVEIIGQEAFRTIYDLKHISFPKATKVGTSLFRFDRYLQTADFESLEVIEEGMFRECESLISVNIPNAIQIKRDAFTACSSLEIVDFPKVDRVEGGAFGTDYTYNIKTFKLENATYVCSLGGGYETLYLPKCTYLAGGATAKELQYVYAPLVETAAGVFVSPNLKSVYMPKLTTVLTKYYGSHASALFHNCYSLEEIDLPNLTEVSEYLFGVGDSSAEVSLKYLNIPKYEGDISSLFYNTTPDFVSGKAPKKDAPTLDNENLHKLSVTSTMPFSAFCDGSELVTEENNGQYIIDTSVPSGSNICLSVMGDDFEGWIDGKGRVKSTKTEYHFISGDDISLTGKFKSTGYVSFYNANGDLICSNSYSQFTENDFPSVPDYYGHTFTGWSMNADEINASIQNGESVTVTAMFEKNMKYYSVNVTGGYVTYTDSDDYNGANSYRELSLIKIKPNYNGTTPFAYWKSSDGSILSYNEELSFYVLNNINIYAVYSDDEIKHQPIIRIINAVPDKDNHKITFAAQREIPSDCTVLSHGIILTSDGTLDENTFIIGADGVLKGTSVKTANSGTYTLYKSNVNVGDTWYARGYVNYKTADGKIKTIYSEIVSSTMEE